MANIKKQIDGSNQKIDSYKKSLSDGDIYSKLIRERIMLKGIYPYSQIRDFVINMEKIEKPSFVTINSIHRYDKTLRSSCASLMMS